MWLPFGAKFYFVYSEMIKCIYKYIDRNHNIILTFPPSSYLYRNLGNIYPKVSFWGFAVLAAHTIHNMSHVSNPKCSLHMPACCP